MILPISFSESKFGWKRLAIHLCPSIATLATSGASLRSPLTKPVAQSYWRDGILALVKLPGKPADVPHLKDELLMSRKDEGGQQNMNYQKKF